MNDGRMSRKEKVEVRESGSMYIGAAEEKEYRGAEKENSGAKQRSRIGAKEHKKGAKQRIRIEHKKGAIQRSRKRAKGKGAIHAEEQQSQERSKTEEHKRTVTRKEQCREQNEQSQ